MHGMPTEIHEEVRAPARCKRCSLSGAGARPPAGTQGFRAFWVLKFGVKLRTSAVQQSVEIRNGFAASSCKVLSLTSLNFQPAAAARLLCLAMCQ